MSDEGDQIDRVAARRNGRRLLLMVGGLALLSSVVVGLVGVLRNHDDGAGHAQHSLWFVVLIVTVVTVIPLAAAAGTLVWLLRRPSYQRVMQYGCSERRRTFQTIKAARPLDPRQRRIAGAGLDYTQRQRWILWLLPVMIAVWLVNGFTHRDDLSGKVQLGLGVVYLLGLPFMFWQRRRAIERTRQALDHAQPS